jgi:hypothetical protein
MKKLTALFAAFAMIFSLISAASGVTAEFWLLGLTDADLVELIETGEIPANVIELDLGNNKLTDITPLAVLTDLKHLFLDYNQITDVTPLFALTGLQQLYLSGNPLTEEQIEELQTALPNTFIAVDVSPVILYNNEITDADLVELIETGEIPAMVVSLDLGINKITDVTPLAALVHLQILHLDENQITDVTPLFALTELQQLDLAYNPLTDEQIEEIRAALPDTQINFAASNCFCENISWMWIKNEFDGWCEEMGTCADCGDVWYKGDCYDRGTLEVVVDGCIEHEFCTECDYENKWADCYNFTGPVMDGCIGTYSCVDCDGVYEAEFCIYNETIEWGEWGFDDWYGECESEGICTECGKHFWGSCEERGTLEILQESCTFISFCTECDYEDVWGYCLDLSDPIVEGCEALYVCVDCGKNYQWYACGINQTVEWAGEWKIGGIYGFCHNDGVCTVCGEYIMGTCFDRGTLTRLSGKCFDGYFCIECDDEWENCDYAECGICNVVPRKIGDVDGDGKVTITDALEILMYLAGLDSALDILVNFDAARAITGGDNPTINDALEILMHLAGMDSAID